MSSKTPSDAVLHLLGFERPLLEGTIEHLFEGKPPGAAELRSLESVVVVVPGRRAGRRLLEGLVAEATERGERGLSPPRVITPGALPEVLLRGDRAVASTVVSRLAWLRTVATCPKELLASLGLAGGVWEETSPSAVSRQQLELAQLLEELREQLSLAGLSETEALERFSQRLDFADEARWEAVAELARRCDTELERRGEMANAKARLALSYRGDPRPEVERIVLVGIAELAPLFRRCLRRFAGRVEALIHAEDVPSHPLELRFDELGCPRVDYWLTHQSQVEDADLRVVDRRGDQVAETVECLHSWRDQGLSPQAITVGLADGGQVEALAHGLGLAGLSSHSPVGRPFVASRPARLLDSLARYMSGQGLAELGALIRHVDLERWLETPLLEGDDTHPAVPRPPLPADGWPSHLDRYVRSTLAQRLDAVSSDGLPLADPLLELDRTLRSLVKGESVGPPLERLPRRPLSDWCVSIGRLLTLVFEAPRSEMNPVEGQSEEGRAELDDPDLEEALQLLGEALRAHFVAETESVGEARVWSFSEVVMLLLAELDGQLLQSEPERDRDAVELLGWLELSLDDAPALVVMGLNEGTLPERVAIDPFLNDRLRGVLGLSNGRSRLARDRFLFDALLRGRRLLTLVAGQRGDDDEPLAPSRLLLGDGAGSSDRAERVAETLLAFYRDRSGGRSGSVPWRHAERLQIPVPRPPAGARVVEPLRVTSFRDYIRCPYRFWLRHGVRLEAVEPAPQELDARSFGTLGHDVLRLFSGDESAQDGDEGRIAERLDQLLDAEVIRRVGPAPPAASRLQVAQLRRRLHRFAAWQAEQVRSGWRIVADLSEVDLEAALDLEDEPFRIRGRIDRVERHPHEGVRLLDYKTADRALSPRRAHRGTSGDPAYHGWIDLQLPLYRELLRPRLEAEASLGYYHLSADLEGDPLALASWLPEELEQAAEAAREVARRVRSGLFWPPRYPPGKSFPDGLEWICQDLVPAVRRDDPGGSEQERSHGGVTS